MNGTDWDDPNSETPRLDGVPVAELLSAYYDGELSAEERQRLEVWLEHHPQARDLLAQFAELSALVGGAAPLSPRERTEVATHGLQARVLSRLTPAATPASRFGRSWRRWGIALVAAAASLGLVILLVPPGARQDRMAANVKAPVPAELQQLAPGPDAAAPTAGNVSTAEGMVAKEMRSAAETVRGNNDGAAARSAVERREPQADSDGSKRALPAAQAAPGRSRIASTIDREATPAGGPAAPSTAPAAPAMAPLSTPAPAAGPFTFAARDRSGMRVIPRSQMPHLAPGTKVDPGEIIQHLATQGDEAVVIEYTVVDVRKTAGELEVLLRRHGIQTLQPEAEVMTAAKPGSPESAMFAIYVEAADDQLVAALNEFRTVPTSVDRIEALADSKSGSGSAEAKSGEKRLATDVRGGSLPRKAESAPEGNAGNPIAEEKGKSSGVAKNDAKDGAEPAYQVPFPLSRSVAEQLPRRAGSAPKQQRYDEYVQQRRSGEAKPDLEVASRVLIVLQARKTEKM